VVVLSGGSPVTTEWSSDCKAILNVYLGGEASGEAVLDNLLGRVNPCGKLAETYPIKLKDNLSTKYFGTDIVQYRESIFVGYRYYDKVKKQVAFPFGHGLSYTDFEYKNIELSSDTIREDDKLRVSFTVKNIGKTAGHEVAQLYVRDTESTVFVAEKGLKEFEKIYLHPGEAQRITLTLDRSAFAFYNTAVKDWCVESGDFEILVGASSRDIRLSATVNVVAADRRMPQMDGLSAYFDLKSDIPQNQFERLLNRRVPEYDFPKKGSYGMNTVVGELDGTLFVRLFRLIFKISSTRVLPKGTSRVVKKSTKKGAMDLPIRNFYMCSAGAISRAFTLSLLEAFNSKNIFGLISALKILKRREKSKKSIYGKPIKSE
jgi:beta-glucosidase